MADTYTPIDCNFYDRIEHFAVLRHPVEMVFRDATGKEHTLLGRILDTLVEQGEEFMIVEAWDHPIRMDRIVRLGEHRNPGSSGCRI